MRAGFARCALVSIHRNRLNAYTPSAPATMPPARQASIGRGGVLIHSRHPASQGKEGPATAETSGGAAATRHLACMPLPKTPCPSCGVPYFPEAMKFHAAKCAVKRAQMVLPCPACGMELRAHEMNGHMLKCSAANSRGRGHAGGVRSGGGQGGAGRSESRPALELLPSALDGRVPCAVCGRKFAPDRIAKHQYICSGLGMGPPAKPGARAIATAPAPSQLDPRRPGRRAGLLGPSGGSCAPAPWVSDFSEGASPLDSPPRPLAGRPGSCPPPPIRIHHSRGGAYDGAPVPDPSRPGWKSQSNQLRGAMRAARGLPARRGQGGFGGGIALSPAADDRGDGFLPCPHCERTFAPIAWARHVPSCKTTIHRPSPPPAAPPPPRRVWAAAPHTTAGLADQAV